MFFTTIFYHKQGTEATVFCHLGPLFFGAYFATAPFMMCEAKQLLLHYLAISEFLETVWTKIKNRIKKK